VCVCTSPRRCSGLCSARPGQNLALVVVCVPSSLGSGVAYSCPPGPHRRLAEVRFRRLCEHAFRRIPPKIHRLGDSPGVPIPIYTVWGVLQRCPPQHTPTRPWRTVLAEVGCGRPICVANVAQSGQMMTIRESPCCAWVEGNELGFGVQGLGLRVWGLSLGLRVSGFGFGF